MRRRLRIRISRWQWLWQRKKWQQDRRQQHRAKQGVRKYKGSDAELKTRSTAVGFHSWGVETGAATEDRPYRGDSFPRIVQANDILRRGNGERESVVYGGVDGRESNSATEPGSG